ncbi:[acyl-carrier-protein] S-malonyltransferase [Carnobacterium divergens]|uniref:ACP S-malonyltransferase n=1 Tax=Carnobacterium divergens TaxID=2748 RepID=UPI000E7120C0|nr:ACP S-malonyltransferase [Carnobacterium divergens]ANZ99717.1 [acyl-carrier-protein] S-malonyltransferase [Carnobacterium divergens]
MKIAFVYSGQGAQYQGMGQELYENNQVVRDVFQHASDALKMDMTSLCFDENEQLNQTTYTQPAILTVSMAIDALLKEHGVVPEVVAGLSLGEYSALVKAGVLDFTTAVQLVKKRGQFMTEAVPSGDGAMSAVMGLDRKTIEEACIAASDIGVVAPANYNMPGQIVIAGLKEAVAKATLLLEEKGAKRIIPLQVSGPFHTALLKPAAMELANELEAIEFHELNLPVISNTTAKIITDKAEVKPLLTRQVMSPVLWEDSVNTMIDMGVDTFIEVGPGKALSSFIKKINRNVTILNVENQKTLDKTIETLKGMST